MRAIAPIILIVFMALVGCRAPVIGHEQLIELYGQTALAEGALSVMPLRVDPSDPPVVVNWWYAGTEGGHHLLVLRELTWDSDGDFVSTESRYRVAGPQLRIVNPMPETRDSRRWLPLHEASAGALPPPKDAVTRRLLTGPEVFQPMAEPELIDPSQTTPPGE